MLYDTPNATTGKTHFGGPQYALSNFGFDTKSTVYTGLIALRRQHRGGAAATLVLRAAQAAVRARCDRAGRLRRRGRRPRRRAAAGERRMRRRDERGGPGADASAALGQLRERLVAAPVALGLAALLGVVLGALERAARPRAGGRRSCPRRARRSGTPRRRARARACRTSAGSPRPGRSAAPRTRTGAAAARSGRASSAAAGGWRARRCCPRWSGVDSISTSSLKASPSGVRTSTVNGVRAIASLLRAPRRRRRSSP